MLLTVLWNDKNDAHEKLSSKIFSTTSTKYETQNEYGLIIH